MMAAEFCLSWKLCQVITYKSVSCWMRGSVC